MNGDEVRQERRRQALAQLRAQHRAEARYVGLDIGRFGDAADEAGDEGRAPELAAIGIDPQRFRHRHAAGQRAQGFELARAAGDDGRFHGVHAQHAGARRAVVARQHETELLLRSAAAHALQLADAR
ncbi:MAG: hypothetical protein IPG43_11110 [Proteobacteria bacterium]|nr:hypothetical protein [Pseudomonadota bacterium]